MRRKRGPQGSLLWLIYTRVELLWRLELHMTYKDPDRPIYDKILYVQMLSLYVYLDYYRFIFFVFSFFIAYKHMCVYILQ